MTGGSPGGWVMWEARAAEGRTQDLLAWALSAADESAQIYTSADRVVVIQPAAGSSPASSRSGELPEPPPELLARPAYQWEFERVR